MSQDKTNDELSELEPLEELSELEEFDELEEVEELEELGPAAKPAAPAARPARSSSRGQSGRGSRKDKKEDAEPDVPMAKPGTESRELEDAPRLLQKAAWVLVAACVFPWMSVSEVIGEDGSLVNPKHFAAKAVILVGAYLFHMALKASYGDKAPGFAQKLDIKVIPAKRRSMGWNVGEFLGIAVMIVGLLPIIEGTGLSLGSIGLAIYGDKGLMILGLVTISHIYSYSKGATFNPLFPILFLGPAFAGLLSIPKGIGWWTAGSVLASVAGVMAVYVIVVAMRQAKAEGDAKRAAQAAARREARKTR